MEVFVESRHVCEYSGVLVGFSVYVPGFAYGDDIVLLFSEYWGGKACLRQKTTTLLQYVCGSKRRPSSWMNTTKPFRLVVNP